MACISEMWNKKFPLQRILHCERASSGPDSDPGDLGNLSVEEILGFS
jgi:hypothetical protein